MEKKKLKLKKVKIAKLSVDALKNLKGGDDANFTTVRVETIGSPFSTGSAYQGTCVIYDGVCVNETNT
ncbi:TIGR04149 family rSAM-modified RiPP [Chryseobacterium oranimense]|uniref:TIGR04149 family rSAM-modified RiPP n=1 Tax=Chryseobacterium oranimense TaxID=421058 RepID=UPI0031D858E2